MNFKHFAAFCHRLVAINLENIFLINFQVWVILLDLPFQVSTTNLGGDIKQRTSNAQDDTFSKNILTPRILEPKYKKNYLKNLKFWRIALSKKTGYWVPKIYAMEFYSIHHYICLL